MLVSFFSIGLFNTIASEITSRSIEALQSGRHAAIDRPGAAGDEAGPLGRQEYHHAGDFLRRCPSGRAEFWRRGASAPRPRTCRSWPSSSRMFLSWRSVRTAVGTTAFTRMPSLPSSLASATVRFCTAALLMPVVMAPSCGVQAAPPEMLTMRPHLRSRMAAPHGGCSAPCRAACCRRRGPSVSSFIAKKLPCEMLVALLTRMSRRPNSASVGLEQRFDRGGVVEVGRHADHAAVCLAFQLARSPARCAPDRGSPPRHARLPPAARRRWRSRCRDCRR